MQADADYRAKADDIGRLKIRNNKGQMVPLAAIMTVQPAFGPGAVTRYNGFFSADINGAPKPGVSSGQAQAEMEKILAETLPRGLGYEWTELVYQEKIAGNTMVLIFPLCVLLVFLVLAATYESWTLPLAIILIVPGKTPSRPFPPRSGRGRFVAPKMMRTCSMKPFNESLSTLRS